MGFGWSLLLGNILHPGLFDNSNLLSAAISAAIIAPAGIPAALSWGGGEMNVSRAREGK